MQLCHMREHAATKDIRYLNRKGDKNGRHNRILAAHCVNNNLYCVNIPPKDLLGMALEASFWKPNLSQVAL